MCMVSGCLSAYVKGLRISAHAKGFRIPQRLCEGSQNTSALMCKVSESALM